MAQRGACADETALAERVLSGQGSFLLGEEQLRQQTVEAIGEEDPGGFGTGGGCASAGDDVEDLGGVAGEGDDVGGVGVDDLAAGDVRTARERDRGSCQAVVV